jgi:hypothetical protein
MFTERLVRCALWPGPRDRGVGLVRCVAWLLASLGRNLGNRTRPGRTTRMRPGANTPEFWPEGPSLRAVDCQRGVTSELSRHSASSQPCDGMLTLAHLLEQSNRGKLAEAALRPDDPRHQLRRLLGSARRLGPGSDRAGVHLDLPVRVPAERSTRTVQQGSESVDWARSDPRDLKATATCAARSARATRSPSCPRARARLPRSARWKHPWARSSRRDTPAGRPQPSLGCAEDHRLR